MASGGRNRTSNEAKQAAGTYSPGRHIVQPRYPPKRPAMPKGLSKEAQPFWNELCEEMAAAKVLTRIDRHMLAAFCETAADYYKRRAEGKNFNASELAQYRMLACEFGMTPASRLRAPPVVEDPETSCPTVTKASADGKVVPISKRLTSTQPRLMRSRSTSADTSSLPATDN